MNCGGQMMKKYLHAAFAVGVLVFGSMSTYAADDVTITGQELEASEVEVVIDQAVIEKNDEVIEKETVVENIETEMKAEIEQANEQVVEEKTDKGQEVADFALKYIGTPYVSGGNNLNKGVDCSGFVQQVYKNFGINLERSSRSQYKTNGISVKKEELRPGDLVFYGYGSVNHVAIYIGDGKIVHAPVPGKTVCTAPLWQRGDANLIGYKRIFK